MKQLERRAVPRPIEIESMHVHQCPSGAWDWICGICGGRGVESNQATAQRYGETHKALMHPGVVLYTSSPLPRPTPTRLSDEAVEAL